ncbi:IQ calmodulin-binding motif-containing protein 1 [Callorhinchus milii]|uniref:IQ calmodulin-binding motif-containing protein 1 n=1 Tax=Callorhinchus milii TaxID=7868 RepID=UPI0004573F3F|nr:IQ calmodulin-binding motif-containing protein 1 [Callorhinchus milii]|eukprot:gi/632981187/ref/XP_007907453.1/ PREDICTED: IQ calmodulin-binding motif-containing protein 1 [Callorhinchus milii]
MSELQRDDVDSRIVALAAKVAESSDQNVPVLLLKLKEILKGASGGSRRLKKLKQDIYDYGLVQYCILVLLHDYSRIRGGWFVAAQLANILSSCCAGLEPKENAEEFLTKVLPSAADNMMVLARRLQARFFRALKADDRKEFMLYFRTVVDSICYLFGGHIQLTQYVFQSDHFLQLLLTDNVEVEVIMMSVLQNILRVNRSVLFSVDCKSIQSVLDELIYKLSATTNPVIGSIATKVMLLLVESHPPTLILLYTDYKGLHSLLSKQWTGRGFGKELSRLLDLLYAGSTQEVERMRFYQAASLIQAAWRAYQTRKRLKKLPKAVTTLQRSFRARQEQEIKRIEKRKAEEELKQQVQLRRHRAIREFRQRQLTLLEIVPASQMDKYLQEEEEKSALLIQTQWRGHRERRAFYQQKQALQAFRAAVVIQRVVLKFLQRRRNQRKALSAWKGPKGLTDQHRIELRQRVEQKIKMHPAPPMSQERGIELHSKAQEMLGQYLLKRNFEQKAEQHREAVLAQINTDIELLINAPSLKNATKENGQVFHSKSVPVATRARQSHNSTLQFIRWPWWRKLGNEFLDPEMMGSEEVDFDFLAL